MLAHYFQIPETEVETKSVSFMTSRPDWLKSSSPRRQFIVPKYQKRPDWDGEERSRREEIGETPVRFLETPRVETARRQLETTALSLEVVAAGLVGSDL